MRSFLHVIRNFFSVFLDALVFIRLCLRPTVAVAAENLFLRKQLGLFVERWRRGCVRGFSYADWNQERIVAV